MRGSRALVTCASALVCAFVAGGAARAAARSPGRAGPGATAAAAREVARIDVHTHLTGALSPSRLYTHGVRGRALYPVALLTPLGIHVPPRHRVPSARGDAVAMDVLEGLLERTPGARARLIRRMRAHEGGGFAELEDAYRYRKPIAKDPRLLRALLLETAAEARAHGVGYLELSAGSLIGNPDVVSKRELIEAVTAAERETGVRLRFLHAMSRLRAPLDNVAHFDRAAAAGLYDPDSPIVGIDVQGHEQNSILVQAPLLGRATDWKRAHPDFVRRVHAGETHPGARRRAVHPARSIEAAGPDNVRLAVALGADRIGHGLHGLSTRVIRALANEGVVVEVNLSSNRTLGYLAAAPGRRHPIHRLLSSGVDVTLGTDGGGMYGTSAPAELDRAIHELELTPRQVRAIAATNERLVSQRHPELARRRGDTTRANP